MRIDRLILGLAIVVFLTIYTLAFFNFLGTEGDSRSWYLMMIGLPLGGVLFLYPRIALLVLGVLVHSIDWLFDVWRVIPREATWLIDILILLLIGRTALFALGRSEKTTPIEKFIYFLVLFALVSAAINAVSKVTLFVGMRVAFRYLGLFVAAYYMEASRDWFRFYIKYLFLIGLVQTPVVILQFFYYGWGDPDQLCGTFGSGQTPAVGIFLLTLVTWMATRIMEERRFHLWQIGLLAWISIAPVLGEVKFFFMFLPILLVFMLRAEFFKRPAMAVGISVAGIMMLVAVDFLIVATGGWAEGRNPLTYIRKLPEVFSKELEDPNQEYYLRTYQYSYASRLALNSPRDFLIGNGPGSVTHSIVSEGHSAVANYFARWGLSSNSVSIVWMLIEYGYIGTIFFLLLLWMIFRRGRILRQSEDIELRIYGRMLENATFIYAAWMFYSAAWQTDTMSFIYWPMAAMIVRFSFIEERKYRAEAKQVDTASVEQPSGRRSRLPEPV